MTKNPESFSHDYEEDPIYDAYRPKEEFREQFDNLIYDAIERLKAMITPDTETVVVDNAQFGALGDGLITFKHTKEFGEDVGGLISYCDADDPEKNLFVRYKGSTPKLPEETIRYPWKTNNGYGYSGGMILQHLDRGWPLSDIDSRPSDEMRKQIGKELHPSNKGEVDVGYIMNILERSQFIKTGKQLHTKVWSSPTKEISINIKHDGTEPLFRTEIVLNVPYYPPTDDNGNLEIMKCRIRRDEIGNITVASDYTRSGVGRFVNQPVQHHDMLLHFLEARLRIMITGKIGDEITRELF